jgi:hypothetical protein
LISTLNFNDSLITQRILSTQPITFKPKSIKMRFSLIAAALPLLAVASPVEKRATDADVTAITTAVGYISGNITKLDGQVNNLGYNDTIGGLFTLFSTGDLQKAVDNAGAAVDATEGTFNDNQSGALSIPLTQLVPKVQKVSFPLELDPSH